MHPSLLRQLEKIDWDFSRSDADAAPGVHWYPGNFVPELPAALVELLTEPEDSVFDPYGGIGTSAAAAVTRARKAICCDFNPVAAMASYTSMGLIVLGISQRSLFDAVLDELERLVSVAGRFQPSLLTRDSEVFSAIDLAVMAACSPAPHRLLDRVRFGSPSIADLQRWYHPQTLVELSDFLTRLEAHGSSSFTKIVGLTMASAVARALSSQTRSWGHIADNVFPREFVYKDLARAASAWMRRTRRRINSISLRSVLPRDRPFYDCQLLDWSQRPAPGQLLYKSKLLITSPPYAGAIDYSFAQRLSLYLLGLDHVSVAALSHQEIGARRKRSGPSHIASWAAQIANALEYQLEWLDSDCFAAFIMPHKDAGRSLGAEALTEVLLARGWALVFERDRSIRQIKARQSWTSIKQETLLIFERE